MNKVIAIELQKIHLEPDDCLFVKVDLNTFTVDEACHIVESVKDMVPKGVTVMGYPGPAVKIQVVRKL